MLFIVISLFNWQKLDKIRQKFIPIYLHLVVIYIYYS